MDTFTSKNINFIYNDDLKHLNYLQIKDYYFIHIPKNAGTSIINQFFKLDNKIGTHYNIKYYPINIRKKTFAICRNPYTRLVSCYNYFKMKKSYWHSNDGSTPYGLHELYDYCNKNTFTTFVKDLCINNKFTNNIHILPQYKWIITPNNQIISKIIKIENINEELSELFNEKIDLIKINKSKSNCDDYYTLESKQLVYEYYKRDFEYFNYDKEFKKIIFFCNWGQSPEQLLNNMKHLTKNNNGIWDTFIGVTDLKNADVVVFLDGIPKNIDCNLLKNKKVLCFPREPLSKKNWEFLNFKHGYTYDNLFHVFTNLVFIGKNYDFLINLQYTSHEKTFSAIISNKQYGDGYTLRRKLLINLANKYPNLCDIYGAGWSDELGISYKGELGNYHKNTNDNTTKYDGLINYKYSLCIENCSIPNYFTEKITDTMLCWTIPIYYGCTNISEYFPEHSYYYVDITQPDCLEKIKKIIEKPITDININALTEARELILNKYNIWNVIKEKINIKQILVCGDSHSNVFNYANYKQSNIYFDVCEVGGATALGSVNPNSKTNALSIFLNKIKNSKKSHKIIIMLGEVDCGFLIWVRSKKYNITINEQIKQSTDNLFDFVKKILNISNYEKKDIIIAGSILPTIKDSTDKRFLNGIRSEVDETQINRTLKTLEYNKILKTQCDKFGYNYIDITSEILNLKTNTVNDFYLNKDPYNHHLDNDKTYKLWINKLSTS